MVVVGAYWKQRKESREEAAARIALFLSTIATKHEVLGTWFLKGQTKARALQTKLPLDPDSIANVLRVNRKDTAGREVMTSLGFSLGIWNGGKVSFSAMVGAYSSNVRNTAVLSFGNEGNQFVKQDWRDLLSAMISAFESDDAVVKARNTGAIEGQDWITYVRGVGLREQAHS